MEQSAPPQPAPVAAQPQPAPVAAQQVAQPPPQQQQEPLQPLKLTGQPTQEFVEQLQQSLLQASWLGVHALRQVLPTALCHRICTQVTPLLKKEPTLLELDPAGQCVSVVGGERSTRPVSRDCHRRRRPCSICTQVLVVHHHKTLQTHRPTVLFTNTRCVCTEITPPFLHQTHMATSTTSATC